jgi:hypothetical protein
MDTPHPFRILLATSIYIVPSPTEFGKTKTKNKHRAIAIIAIKKYFIIITLFQFRLALPLNQILILNSINLVINEVFGS